MIAYCDAKRDARSRDLRFAVKPADALAQLRSYMERTHTRALELFDMCRFSTPHDIELASDDDGLSTSASGHKGLSQEQLGEGLNRSGCILVGNSKRQLSARELSCLFERIDRHGHGVISLKDLRDAIFHFHNFNLGGKEKPMYPKPPSPTKIELAQIKKDRSLSNRARLHARRHQASNKAGIGAPAPASLSRKAQMLAEAKLEAEFAAEFDECQAALSLLNERVASERTEWTVYWNKHYFEHAVVIQRWIRGIRGRQSAQRWKEHISAVHIQASIRRHRDRLRFLLLKCTVVVQRWIRQSLAMNRVARMRKNYNSAATFIQSIIRGWKARHIYKHMVAARNATAEAIVLGHQRHASCAKIQRQFRRFQGRRKVFRFRAVVRAAQAKEMQNKMPGRFDLSCTSVEEELDACLRRFRSWNPRPHHSKYRRPKTPEIVVSIRRDRQRKHLHLEETKKIVAEKKPTYQELVNFDLSYGDEGATKRGYHAKQRTRPIMVIHDKREDHMYGAEAHLEPHVKTKKQKPPEPSFTAILNKRCSEYLRRDAIIEYKVRWKGPAGNESWIPRSLLVDPTLFSKVCINLVHEYEAYEAARKAHVSRVMVDSAASVIQRFMRGFVARSNFHRMQYSAILIQTAYRAAHNLLEPRRQRLLAARYELQVREENEIYRLQAVKERENGSTRLSGEMNCILDEVMKTLQEDAGKVEDEGESILRYGCMPIPGGWICLRINCGYENEPLQDRCDLCLKRRPKETLQFY